MRVIAAGMRRAGSTWQYNCARLLLARHGGLRFCGFEDKYIPGRGEHEIIKIHRWRPELLFGADVVLTTHRDPRDVAASAVRRGLCKPDTISVMRWLLRAIADEYDPWATAAHLDQCYEDLMKRGPDPANGPVGKHAAACAIAEQLGTPATADEIMTLCQEIETLPVGRAVDDEILLHPGHRTTDDGGVGAWQTDLRPGAVAAVIATFGDWMSVKGPSEPKAAEPPKSPGQSEGPAETETHA